MKRLIKNISFRLGFLSMVALFVGLNVLDYMGSDRPHLANVPHYFGQPFTIYAWPSPIGMIGFHWFNIVVDVIIIFILASISGLIFRSVSLFFNWANARRH